MRARTVSELMRTDVHTVRETMLLPDVVALLAEEHVSALPVVDAGDRPIGVISSADVLMAQAEAPDRWSGMTVDEVMTTPALTIGPDATVRDALHQLLYTDVHRVFVVSQGRLVGVLSQTDVIRALAAHRLTV